MLNKLLSKVKLYSLKKVYNDSLFIMDDTSKAVVLDVTQEVRGSSKNEDFSLTVMFLENVDLNAVNTYKKDFEQSKLDKVSLYEKVSEEVDKAMYKMPLTSFNGKVSKSEVLLEFVEQNSRVSLTTVTILLICLFNISVSILLNYFFLWSEESMMLTMVLPAINVTNILFALYLTATSLMESSRVKKKVLLSGVKWVRLPSN